MKFALKDLVEYNGKTGVVTFVDPAYIIVSLPPHSEKHNSPGLIVFPENQNKVKKLNE